MERDMPDALLLGIETSSSFFSVAVSRGEKILAARTMDGMGRPAELLSGMIEESLASAGQELGQMDGLAVSIGPGSFTGLRIGVITAKTIAWALKKPVLPVSSLEVIAWNLADSKPASVRVILDARKGKIYMAQFSFGPDGAVKRMTQDRLTAPEEAFQRLEPATVLTGDGMKKYGPDRPAPPPEKWIPSAENVCRIAARRWPAGALDDPHKLVPQYLWDQLY